MLMIYQYFARIINFLGIIQAVRQPADISGIH
jgi:hypothetical protein